MNNNNFNLIRIILSLVVVVAHFITLLDFEDKKILLTVFNSYAAVKGFFVISGYLVYKSYTKNYELKKFYYNRILRIMPGYYFVMIITLIAIIIIFNYDLNNAVNILSISKYIIFNIIFLGVMQPNIEGIFIDNVTNAVNGSLWTIKVELCLYIIVPLIYIILKKIGQVKGALIIYAISILWIITFKYLIINKYSNSLIHQFPGQLAYFIMGIYLTQFKKIELKYFICSVVSLTIIHVINEELISTLFTPFFFSLIIIYLSSMKEKININKYGDFTYGFYLLHFPLIQILIEKGIINKEKIISSLLITIVLLMTLAMISWHFVEKRFINKKC